MSNLEDPANSLLTGKEPAPESGSTGLAAPRVALPELPAPASSCGDNAAVANTFIQCLSNKCTTAKAAGDDTGGLTSGECISSSCLNELIPLARELYGSLEVGRLTLVHGDFHHHNILASARGYLAIDSKAMLGEPEFDVPSFLWNPLPYRMRPDVTERRIAAFGAAGLDEERIRRWAVIRGAYLGADADEVRVLRALVS